MPLEWSLGDAMKPIRTMGLENLDQMTKSGEFHVFMKDVLPRANAFVEFKRERIQKIIGWSVFAVFAVACLITGLIALGSDMADSTVAVIFSFGVGGVILSLFKVLKFRSEFLTASFETGLEKIGQYQMNIAFHPTEGGSVAVDEDGLLDTVTLQHQNLKDFNITKSTIEEYSSAVNQIPVVLTCDSIGEFSSQDGTNIRSGKVFHEENQLSEIYRRIRQSFQSVETSSISMSLISPDSPFWRYIVNSQFENHARELKPLKSSKEALDRIMGIIGGANDNADSVDIDVWSLAKMRMISEDALKLTLIRHNALSDVVANLYSRLSDIVNYSSFLFYCPYCHEHQLTELLNSDFNAFASEPVSSITWNDNARVYLVDWKTEKWRCKACERETNHPIPIHKIYKQIIHPAYESLLQENEKDRIKTYSTLKEKKIHYKQEAEKETEQITRENRRDLDEQVFKLRAMDAQVRSTRRTVQSMQTLMLKLETVSRERMAEIDRYAEDIQLQIVSENKQIERDIHQEVEDNIQKTNVVMNRLAYQAQIEQQKQMAVQVAIAQGIQNNDQNTAATAQNTSTMVSQNNQLIQNTSRIVSATEDSAACAVASARQAGQDKASPWRIDKTLQRGCRIFGDTITGRSQLDSARRR